MNPRWIFIFQMLSTFIPGFIAAQDSVIPRNKIAEQVSAAINKRGETYTYSYTVRNGAGAEQSIWRFRLIIPETVQVSDQRAPEGWDPSYGIWEYKNCFVISWGSPFDFDISPGSSLGGFSFATTKSIPGIVTYYAEGYAPPPSFEPGMAPDSIPGYDDLTPYGPGVVGKTVGPVPLPSLLTPVNFLDTLISYKHQCLTLGWLIDKPQHEKDEDGDEIGEGVVKRLDRRLNRAREALVKGDSSKARGELEKFINKVEELYKESQHREQEGEEEKFAYGGLSSEGYALLRYNAEYLRDRLNVEDKSGYDLIQRHMRW